MHELSIIAILKYGIVGFFGAVVNAIMRYQDGLSKTWGDAISTVIVGSFAGLMFGLVAFTFFPHAEWYVHSMFIGAGAVMGERGLKLLAIKVLEILEVLKPEIKE